MKAVKKLALVCIVMVFFGALTAVSASAVVESGTCGDNLTWSLDTDSGVLIISGKGEMWDYDAYYSYYSDYGSGRAPWLTKAPYIDTITINESVTSIGDWAFDDCTNLASITIPNSVTSIGDSAFEDCTGLKSVTIGNSVTSIGYEAFNKCTSLTSITIPDSVTSIGDGAFRYCYSLKSITIPDSVTSIGGGAFYNTAYYNNSLNWKNDVLYIGKYLIDAKSSITGSYKINSGTKCIADRAFYYCKKLTGITIPNSVTNIGEEVFMLCSALKSITIPDSVTNIGESAFQECTGLTSITIPNSVTHIDQSAFYACNGLKSIEILNKDCKISPTYETIPSNAKIIGFSGSTAESYAKTYNRTFEIHQHSYTSKVTKKATCTKSGVRTYTCPCGKSYTKSISPYHNYSSKWTTDKKATCTESGSKSHHCTRCSAKKDVTTIKATGHSYGSWTTTKSATCTEKGSKKRTCSDCGKVSTSTIAALGHNYSTKWTTDKKATCTESGSKSHHCTRCSAKTDVTTIKATGHSYGSWTTTKSATCTEKGSKKRTCSDCGKVSTSTIAALGHNYSSKWTTDKKETCTESGSKSHHCTRCSAKTDVTTIKATGHSYGSWTTTKSATCTEKGSKKRTCSDCGKVSTSTIAALGHKYKTTTVKATTSKNGSVTTKCSRCNNVKSKETIYKISSVKLSKTSYTFDGNVKTPTVTVKNSNGEKLKKNTDYTVSYQEGRQTIGKYTVTVMFKGKYSGSKKLSFNIVLGKVTGITQLDEKGIIFIWDQVYGADGYEVYYYDSSAKKYVKLSKTVNERLGNSGATGSMKLKIRAYREANGVIYYGEYSNPVTLKAKK